MNNAELIKALRCCIVDFNSTQSRLCNECPYRIYADGKKDCENKAKRAAADALEADDKMIDVQEKEIERLNKELEIWSARSFEGKIGSMALKNMNLKMRIAELEAQLPKEGEWIQMNGHRYCNVCGHKDSPILTNYCPNCGAKMKGEQK